MAKWAAYAALALPTAMFGVSVYSCVWIEFNVLGGMEHMHLPLLLLLAHCSGLTLFIGLFVLARRLERFKLEHAAALILICMVGTWGAFRNGPFWTYAESIECALVRVCR